MAIARWRLCAVALNLGALALPMSAEADPALTAIPGTATTGPNGSYVTATLGGAAYAVPRFNHYQVATGGDLFRAMPQVSGVGGAFVFGYVLPEGMLTFLGAAPRVEFLIDGIDAAGTDTATLTGSFHQLFTSIDGSFSGEGALVKNAFVGTLKTN